MIKSFDECKTWREVIYCIDNESDIEGLRNLVKEATIKLLTDNESLIQNTNEIIKAIRLETDDITYRNIMAQYKLIKCAREEKEEEEDNEE